MLLEVVGNSGSLGACLISACCSDWPKVLGLPVVRHGLGYLPICIDLQFPALGQVFRFARYQAPRKLLKALTLEMQCGGWWCGWEPLVIFPLIHVQPDG